MPIKQFYNSRTKQWVKIDTDKKGGIIETSNEKFTGIPEKGKGQDTEPDPEPKDPKPKDPDKNEGETFIDRIFGG